MKSTAVWPRRQGTLAIGCIAVAGALLLASCSSGSATKASKSPSSGVTGVFSWKRFAGQSITVLAETQPWTNNIQPLTSQFEALTGIHVNWEIYTEEQRRQLAVVQLQSGRPSFDVFMNLKSFSGPEYAQAGWFENLKPMVYNKSLTAPNYNPSDFLSGPWNSQIINGNLDGIPTNVEGPVLFYRTDIFKQYHISPPATLSDVIKDAQLIEQRSNHQIVGITSRGLPAAVAYTFGTFLHNYGGHWIVNGKSGVDTSAGVSALTAYTSMLKTAGPPGVVSYNFLQSSTLFGEGKAAMEFDSSNELSDILKLATPTVANNFSVMEFPSGPGGEHPTVLSWSLAMSPYSHVKDAAWYFIQWATSPSVQLQLALKGIASPRGSTTKNPTYSASLTGVRSSWIKALDKTLSQGNPNVGPPIVQQAQARQIIGVMVDKVLLGQATPQQAASSAASQLDALKVGG